MGAHALSPAGARPARRARAAHAEPALCRDRPREPAVRRHRRGRPPGSRPQRPDVAGGAAGELKTHNGATVVVTAATGIYQSQAQLLDLFGDVTLTHQNGTTFTTDTARVNVADNTAQGDDPIHGHGPSGDIRAEGFRVLDKGDTIVFTGRSDVLLNGVKQTGPKSEPPALPQAVAHQAAAVEREARPALAAAARAEAARHPAARRPVQRGPAHRAAPHTAARQHPRKPAAHAKNG